MRPVTEGFVMGVIFTASITSSLFFLKFWRRTQDPLFLAFSVAFLLESSLRLSLLFNDTPNESGPWYYFTRMFAFLLIIVAILRKNYGRR